MKLESMSFRYDGRQISVLDQTRLPHEQVWLDATEPRQMIEAIKSLRVRGAPLIGLAAAVALAHAAQTANEDEVRTIAGELRASRPTAVNLMYCLDRLMKFAPGQMDAGQMLNDAAGLFYEDQALCDRIAKHGADFLKEKIKVSQFKILTHCNTGGLATAGVGTAIGVIRELNKQLGNVHVFVDETRPLLQGGRLTAWEMAKLSISHTLICDSMAASLMRDGRVNCVIVGCDRIARNGDFANKIGTYSLAVLARHHGIPLFVAGPSTTVDLQCESAKDIPIEEREAAEVRGVTGSFGNMTWAPAESPVWNPAFDVTPHELVAAWILDRGVYTEPAVMVEEMVGSMAKTERRGL